MSGKNNRLVAGLGNPGDAYAKTRHNIGFMVVDALSGEYSIPVEKKKFDASYGRGVIEGIEVILVKPMAFMNRSGPPIQSLSGYYKISCDNMLIIYDDVDLAFGRLKINEKGGNAVFVQDRQKLIEYLIGTSKSGEVIFTVGAGNLYEIHSAIKQGLEKKSSG